MNGRERQGYLACAPSVTVREKHPLQPWLGSCSCLPLANILTSINTAFWHQALQRPGYSLPGWTEVAWPGGLLSTGH